MELLLSGVRILIYTFIIYLMQHQNPLGSNEEPVLLDRNKMAQNQSSTTNYRSLLYKNTDKLLNAESHISFFKNLYPAQISTDWIFY